MNFSELLTKRFLSTITQASSDPNQIFILEGLPQQINAHLNEELFADLGTFYAESGLALFNKEWFSRIFAELNKQKEYHIVSFAQYSHLLEYISKDFFKDRSVLIDDNLRNVFPLPKESFLEKTENEDIEKRPENLPVHHSQQIKIGDSYFYIQRDLPVQLKKVNLFTRELDVKSTSNKNLEVLDSITDKYAINLFINRLQSSNNVPEEIAIKFHKKQKLDEYYLKSIKLLNGLLQELGSELFLLEESTVTREETVKPKTQEILKKYWGPTAAFRKLRVYESPNLNQDVVEISQGHIVETIIDEYHRSKKGAQARDLFLTAPTGAGKSLLFQLPAFYISSNKDVTIVVSPLIALMKDQVSAIVNERKFEKVAFLNSELTLIDRERLIKKCHEGEIDVIYLSPELLLSYDIRHFIGERNLGLLVIDEAHLITTWGRDFRVDYWFLGNHIRKMRKYHELKFPLVAVTATAIYGGENDMVFDSIDSLNMNDPHIYVGEVRRNDIEFLVNNYDGFDKGYEKKKLAQTVEFIKEISTQTSFKTLVYAPYTKHVRQIRSQLTAEGIDVSSGYYGSLDKDLKQHAYEQFLSGEKQVMISTKAFGMGVDISDIQVVYHHAPSGLLPDYVQEVGRLARDPKIKGYAALNYSTQDQRFTKALHGMSALKPMQLVEVLKKILKAYRATESRNILLSVDDFAHIFQESDNLDQKVLTSLMMIEKDYLNKHRFNVLIARPKKLFVKVFARVENQDLPKLKSKYQQSIKPISHLENYQTVVEMDLDTIWSQHFEHKSFPMLKRDFYLGKLFKEDGVKIDAQLKVQYDISNSFNQTLKSFENFLDIIKNCLASYQGGFFNETDFISSLDSKINNENTSRKLGKFILATYSGRLIKPGVIEDNAFLQRRKAASDYEYRVFSNRYLSDFAALSKTLIRLFKDNDSNTAVRFITNKETSSIKYARLGYLLELIELGSFEIKGGENPMVFIRINDPSKIERDINSYYQNTLLKKTLDRHYLSNEIFDHFFLKSFEHAERWDFIEDFFLGMDLNGLLEKYPGKDNERIDILSYLKSVDSGKTSEKARTRNTSLNYFPADTKIYYTSNNMLTLEVDGKNKTLKVSKWLRVDPVSFDKARLAYDLKVDKEIFEVLISKLKANHFEYFKKTRGLNMHIHYNDRIKVIKAIIPYKNEPLSFYKWWINNQNEVYMSFKEKMELLVKVYELNPSILKANHKAMISRLN
jgi:RecQ family ATP-dependent DNA helicase